VLQLLVSATDLGTPERSGRAGIRVVVRRSAVPPAFERATYDVTLSENVRAGSGIATVRARDPDLSAPDALRYEVRGIEPAPQYFGVDPESGAVTVTGDVLGHFALSYTVSTSP
jgi:hypothetical protein